MANIHVNRGTTGFGVLSEEDVREGLRTGRFVATDLGWREGMATWQTLAQFPEFAAEIGGAAAPPPGAAPASTPAAISPVATVAAQSGLPWDRRQELGLFNAFIETLKIVLLNPVQAFTVMKTEGGLGEPLIYAVIGGSIGFIVYILFTMLMSSFGIMADKNAFAGVMGMGIGAIFVIILMPIFVTIGLFIGAAILHLCLMIVGGAKRSFETTFRVVCFSAGSAYPLMIVPFCGGIISGIWCIVLECIGLGRAHGTDTGRAVLAVFLPLVVCCGGGFLLAMMFGLLGALTGH